MVYGSNRGGFFQSAYLLYTQRESNRTWRRHWCGMEDAYKKINIFVAIFFFKRKLRKQIKGRQIYRCLRLLGRRGGSPWGFWNMSRNIGSNLRKITVDTSKLRSSRPMRLRKSWERFDMSDHFFILLKNWIKLEEKKHNTHILTYTPPFMHEINALDIDHIVSLLIL